MVFSFCALTGAVAQPTAPIVETVCIVLESSVYLLPVVPKPVWHRPERDVLHMEHLANTPCEKPSCVQPPPNRYRSCVFSALMTPQLIHTYTRVDTDMEEQRNNEMAVHMQVQITPPGPSLG